MIEEIKNPIYLKIFDGVNTIYSITSLETVEDDFDIDLISEEYLEGTLSDRYRFKSVERITRDEFKSAYTRVQDSKEKVIFM